jgi:protocatechuate 3,4-dioxygenase beta subunit
MAGNKKHWLWVLLVIPGIYLVWYTVLRPARQPVQEVAQTAADDAASKLPKPPPPAYDPITESSLHSLERGTEYLLTGKVTSDMMEALAGATVSVFSQAPRWSPPAFDQPPPVDTQTCDAEGNYQIHLHNPMNLWIVIHKDGYAQIQAFVPVRDPKTAERDFKLQPAQATVMGVISDKDEHPVAGALVVANPPPLATVADSPVPSPVGRVTDSTGQFMIEGLPDGDVNLFVFAHGYLMQEEIGVLRAAQPQQVNFTLSSGSPLSLLVKNTRGEAVPYSIAAAPGHFKIAGGDSRGAIEFAVPAVSSPFECTIMAEGYKASTVTLDPKAIPLAITLEDKTILKGRVISDSGGAIEGALVSVYGTGGLQGKFDGAVETDKTGHFAYSLSYPPAYEIRATKTGYFEQRLTLAPGKPAPPAVEMRMKSVEAGVYGRVVDYRGVPVPQFVVHIRNTAGGSGSADYQRAFSSDRGAFAVTDIAPGTYNLLIQSIQSANTDDVQLVRMDGLEFRKGFLYGEIIAQFPKPKYKK